MKEEPADQRLMRTPQEVHAQIDERVRPVAEQVLQKELERLRSESQHQKSILQDCLTHIDKSILNCQAQLDEYRQTHSDLVAINERLANLGAGPVAIPDHFPSADLGDLILERLEAMRAKAKI